MKKITQRQIRELAGRALESGNPYIRRATAYYIGNTPMFLYAGERMTREEIDEAYLDTAGKDIRAGYEQRGVGFYDKWYRYNHADEGRAYDLGVMLAASTAGCSENFQIIPCIH